LVKLYAKFLTWRVSLTMSDEDMLDKKVIGTSSKQFFCFIFPFFCCLAADDRIPSTLVFEIEEGSGRVNHIMAMSAPHAIKLRQKYKSAKKLHIYNDHIFLASKLNR